MDNDEFDEHGDLHALDELDIQLPTTGYGRTAMSTGGVDGIRQPQRPTICHTSVVDLSYSQVLETKSKHRNHSKKRLNYTRPLSTLSETTSDDVPKDDVAKAGPHKRNAFAYNSDDVDDLAAEQQEQRAKEHDDDNEWSHGDISLPGDDVYRFVQPRRLSSWVQDDAVYACFKCHVQFSLIVRKHHCRACGRIFCNACSNQRLVIPVDYESTPVSHAIKNGSNHTYSSVLVDTTSHVIGSLGYYVWNYNTATPSLSSSANDFSEFHATSSSSFDDPTEMQKTPAELEREKFLRAMTSLESRGLVRFTAAATSGRVKIKLPPRIPPGTVLQRVCDDCASALQQRRQHYNTVQVFELCKWDIQTLRVLGQVCRKWHRASIMCLSTFRQVQYYLPSHPLSAKERHLVLRNRQFLAGHSKWLLQLVKAVAFDSDNDDDGTTQDILRLMVAPRTHNCMMTMCSRLCRHELACVDALEILSSDSIQNVTLRNLCVEALVLKASDDDWLSFLPVVLHALGAETSVSTLRSAIVRQATRDVRFCSDLYWGASVLAEDRRWRRKFDGFRQQLLLTLAAHDKRSVSSWTQDLLHGQAFLDVLWNLPHRADKDVVGRLLDTALRRTPVFSTHEEGLRLPVDPLVKARGVDFASIKVMRSAEAPIILTCTGIERPGTCLADDEKPPPPTSSSVYRVMYKRDDLRKDACVQNIIHIMYSILKAETRQFNIALVTYRVIPTSSYDGLIQIVENAHTLYSIVREHGTIMRFLHHYNGHRTLSDISSSFRESLAAYTVITFLLGVGDRHAENVMLTQEGNLFHIDYGFILGKDPKPLQPPMRLDNYMLEALGGPMQVEAFKALCVVAFNCLRRHVSLFLIMLRLVVDAVPEVTDFGVNYTQADLDAFVVERFLPGQTDEEAATAIMLRMEGKLNEKIGLTLSDFVHAHASEKTVSKGVSSMKVGVESIGGAVQTVTSSLSSSASSLLNGPHNSIEQHNNGGMAALPVDTSQTDALNLQVLQRQDNQISDIVGTASHVVVYEFDQTEQSWKRKEVEGSLFIVKRYSAPRFQMFVNNRLSTSNLTISIDAQLNVDNVDDFLILRCVDPVCCDDVL
ncbi:hypothetical protein, variant 2 [Aphanomyces astaci]|uniref:Phosphatidylinositol 3-kinase n=1 Tax=Aphanomyces astaci TaxID=112090 RepID=W4HDN1_APHAT|nr:hypothetical protein, variant 1 [Aphanomyces astaci]XP_009822092.1 hypothetical protein, variant 2 [Aphanomyces astaci]ETV89691.1 hypothetical protein, variant 1 [Aphanomyces astaci]ETV89692.1 hypothetical protein, variant 2 [Aphanomyces astaci]|eukprot:XP_009822091.1 hypothetical protein, variant 1 [Aphanomyces astaci]